MTAESALNRKESRGAHARDDYKERNDDEWMKHTLATLDLKTLDVSINYKPVITETLTDRIKTFPPKPRVY